MGAAIGTIPYFSTYQPGALPIASTVYLEIVDSLSATAALSYNMSQQDLVGKAPSIIDNANPVASDRFAFYQVSSGLPKACTLGNFGIPFGNVPTGGTVGQILVKNTAVNYDASWTTTISTTLGVIGTTLITGTFGVVGTANFTGGAFNVTSSVNIAGNTNFTGQLSLTGNALITGNLNVTGIFVVNRDNFDTATFIGSSSNSINVRIQNSFVSHNWNVGVAGGGGGSPAAAGSFFIWDDTAGATRLEITSTGTVSFTSVFKVVGSTIVTGTFSVVGTTLVTGAFGVVGTTIATGALSIVGTTLVTGTFGIVGTTLATGTFGVVGTATMTGILNVIGTANLISNAAGATGVVVTAYQNSASPAVADKVALFQLDGNNSAAARKTYSEISAQILSTTAGAEYGCIRGQVLSSGVMSDTALGAETFLLGYQNPASDNFEYVFRSPSGKKAYMYLESYDPGATGPGYNLWHNSPSQAANDIPGYLAVDGNADNGTTYMHYSEIDTIITNANTTGGGARMVFKTISSAVMSETMSIDDHTNLVIGTGTIASAAANGFLYLPATNGTPTGTPTSYAGHSPVVIDSTNNRIYFYSSGAWRNAGP